MKSDLKFSSSGVMTAIEPGNEWFKMVEVSRNPGAIKVKRMLVRRAAEVEPLAGPNLLKALGLGELAGESVVLCLPRQAVNVRLFDLPSGDPQEIADMVDLQIARQTPYSRDEIVFDYRAFRSEKEGYTRVMLVIAQTGVVRQKYRLLEDAGLSVGLVTTTTDGWLAALQEGMMVYSQRTAGATVFLDVDAGTSDLVVLSQGVPLFSRSLPVGMEQWSSRDEQLKDKALQEITMALETFRNEVPSVPVVALALTPLAAGNPMVVKLLESTLGLEIISVLIPGGEGQAGGGETSAISMVGILGAAAALGMLQIDLTPESVRLRKSVMTKARQLTVMAMLVVAVASLLSLYVMSRVNRQQVYLDELNVMIGKTTDDADRIESMRRRVGVVADRMAINMVPARALVELLGLAPDTMAFTAIQISEASQLICRGTAETVSDTVRLVNAMEASSVFQNVKSTRTVAVKERTEFEIACDLEKKRP